MKRDWARRWVFKETNCGDLGVAAIGSFIKLVARDCDGDYATWSVTWRKKQIACGSTREFDTAIELANEAADVFIKALLNMTRARALAAVLSAVSSRSPRFNHFSFLCWTERQIINGHYSNPASYPLSARSAAETRLLRRLSQRREAALSSDRLSGEIDPG